MRLQYVFLRVERQAIYPLAPSLRLQTIGLGKFEHGTASGTIQYLTLKC